MIDYKKAEIFLPVKNFEESYKVSNKGNVWSLYRNKMLKPRIINRHLNVELYGPSQSRQVYVKNLVAEHFIDNPKNYEIVGQWDNDPFNTSVDNLFWVSYIEQRKIAKQRYLHRNISDNDPIKIRKYNNYGITRNGVVVNLTTGKPLTPTISNGYKRVMITNSPLRKQLYIHKLLAKTFIANPNNYKHVLHKDKNKMNNHITNLEWCDQKIYNIHMQIRK